jgi:3'(2'), 5'-bisphosphate nucleotidase
MSIDDKHRITKDGFAHSALLYSDLLMLKELARDGGKLALDIYTQYCNGQASGGAEMKPDKTIFTKADREVNAYCVKTMIDCFGIPRRQILSEERDKKHTDLNPFDAKRYHDCYYTLDPVDGSDDFFEKTGLWSVMLSKVEHHIPVIGVVCYPTQGKLYYTMRGMHAFVDHAVKDKRAYIDPEKAGTAMLATSVRKLEDAVLVLSRKDTKGEKLAKWKSAIPVKEITTSGSFGVKACGIADQTFDCYVNESGRCGIWDVAPNFVILQAAGGKVTHRDGSAISFDPRKTCGLPADNGQYKFALGALCSNGVCHEEFLKHYRPFALSQGKQPQ